MRLSTKIVMVAALVLLYALWRAHLSLVDVAVRDARDGMIEETELLKVEVQRELTERRLKAAETANKVLMTSLEDAERDASAFEQELADYAASLPENPSCVVTDDLYQRLR